MKKVALSILGLLSVALLFAGCEQKATEPFIDMSKLNDPAYVISIYFAAIAFIGLFFFMSSARIFSSFILGFGIPSTFFLLASPIFFVKVDTKHAVAYLVTGLIGMAITYLFLRIAAAVEKSDDDEEGKS